MRRTLAPVGRRLAEVTAHRRVGAYDVVTCDDPDGPAPDPGQFYMLAGAERWGGDADERPFLPRAFSVLRRHGDGTLDFLLEDVGPGTARLCALRPGDGLWILGPLGRGFAPPREGRRPILAGGGVGVAPLAIWSDHLAAANGPDGLAGREGPDGLAGREGPDGLAGREGPDGLAGREGPDGLAPGAAGHAGPADAALVLLGFRDAPHAEGAELIAGARVATDDGSVGERGLVTELLSAELALDSRAEVYACGPPPMLEAVRELCASLAVPAQLALESGMACGFGACFGCVVPTRNGYVRLCVDGPVLDADELETALVPGAGH